jgi:hypothetical protein
LRARRRGELFSGSRVQASFRTSPLPQNKFGVQNKDMIWS